jgi:2,4-dienoyl-CoA reductase-like NADH-dependent reductase (Old Yellow Enzyme family)
VGVGDRASGGPLSALFEPLTFSGLTLDNRFVMAPMTRRFSPGGVPGPDVAAYYARRAAAGVGLIITEGTYIDHPSAGSSAEVPRFHGPDALAGWSEVLAAVHAEGGRIFPQLWHVGALRPFGAPPFPAAPPVGPSGLSLEGNPHGEALSSSEIDAIVGAFAAGARDAQALGFDGVEIHGAHGYLVDQFLWSTTNRRTDGYGGSIASRVRFAADIVAAIREQVGPELPISFRLSQWKSRNYDARLADDPDELAAVLTPLVDAGVSIFHASVRRYWEPIFDGSKHGLSGWVKELTGLPAITVGSVGLDRPHETAFSADPRAKVAPLDALADLFERGEFDLVAIGRALLADPAWVGKVRAGRVDDLVAFDGSHTAVLH